MILPYLAQYHNTSHSSLLLEVDDHDHNVIDPTAEPSTLSAENPKDKGKNKR